MWLGPFAAMWLWQTTTPLYSQRDVDVKYDRTTKQYVMVQVGGSLHFSLAPLCHALVALRVVVLCACVHVCVFCDMHCIVCCVRVVHCALCIVLCVVCVVLLLRMCCVLCDFVLYVKCVPPVRSCILCLRTWWWWCVCVRPSPPPVRATSGPPP